MYRRIPRFISILVIGIGVMDIASSLIPAALYRWQIIRDFLPIEIIHTSRTLTLVGGIYLISLGRALWQQKKRAWFLTITTLILTLFFHLSKGLDIEETLVTAIILATL